MTPLPRAILFDLDDTLLSAYHDADRAWRTVLSEYAVRLGSLDPELLTSELTEYANQFWSDPERHRYWRLRFYAARREIVRAVFEQLAQAGHPLDEALAFAIADRFCALREEQLFLFPGAIETLAALQHAGVALALLTNGAADLQRAKVDRFGLARYFHHIQIEGEAGFGKPEERAYRHAMQALSVQADETWMVGDNLEWEVVAPQRLGIHAIWHDVAGRGLPHGSTVKPDRIIRSVRELIDPELEPDERAGGSPRR